MIDSGNGTYLIYRLPNLPVDFANTGGRSGDAVPRVPQAEKFDGPDGTVDTSMFNPSRIYRVAGTLNVKGEATEERPHRGGGLIEAPAEQVAVPAELLQQLAGRASGGAALPRTTVSVSAPSQPRGSSRPAPAKSRRFGPYPATSGSAVLRGWLPQNSGGDRREEADPDHAVYVCCRLLLGFDLSYADAWDLLITEWNARCSPPCGSSPPRRGRTASPRSSTTPTSSPTNAGTCLPITTSRRKKNRRANRPQARAWQTISLTSAEPWEGRPTLTRRIVRIATVARTAKVFGHLQSRVSTDFFSSAPEDGREEVRTRLCK